MSDVKVWSFGVSVGSFGCGFLRGPESFVASFLPRLAPSSETVVLAGPGSHAERAVRRRFCTNIRQLMPGNRTRMPDCSVARCFKHHVFLSSATMLSTRSSSYRRTESELSAARVSTNGGCFVTRNRASHDMSPARTDQRDPKSAEAQIVGPWH